MDWLNLKHTLYRMCIWQAFDLFNVFRQVYIMMIMRGLRPLLLVFRRCQSFLLPSTAGSCFLSLSSLLKKMAVIWLSDNCAYDIYFIIKQHCDAIDIDQQIKLYITFKKCNLVQWISDFQKLSSSILYIVRKERFDSSPQVGHPIGRLEGAVCNAEDNISLNKVFPLIISQMRFKRRSLLSSYRPGIQATKYMRGSHFLYQSQHSVWYLDIAMVICTQRIKQIVATLFDHIQLFKL